MASHQRYFLLSLLLTSSILFISRTANCEDEEETLLQQINSYRTSLNLTVLKHNDNAECLADGIADEYKNQVCTNTTGANTVPGTEAQFANYPKILESCHLNVTTTRDGVIMPACIPSLAPSLVLSNFTGTQYSNSLNGSKYTGIGIGSENDWIVVVLTTDTPEGNYQTSTNDHIADSSAGSVSMLGVLYQTLLFTISFWILM